MYVLKIAQVYLLEYLKNRVFNKYGEKGSLKKSELKGLIGYRYFKNNWHGMTKIVSFDIIS